MPINPTQINPLDLNPSQAIGIDLPLNAPSVFKPNYQTKDAIKYNLINFFLTDPGERPMNPTFGGGIKAFIFQQITNNSLEFLQEEIQNKISINFSTIVVEDLNIINESDNSIRIKLNYSISNTNLTDEINIII
jgi:phage baseplate assembly protein W